MTTCDHVVFIGQSRLSPYKATKGKKYVCENCYELVHLRTNAKKKIFAVYPDLYCTSNLKFKGEQKCKAALLNIGVKELVQEFKFFDLPGKCYDFKFKYEGDDYILEFDGDQHFKFVDMYHKSLLCLEIQKANDIKYTKEAIQRNHKIIRINYAQLNFIEEHVRNALHMKQQFYLSDPTVYSHFSFLIS